MAQLSEELRTQELRESIEFVALSFYQLLPITPTHHRHEVGILGRKAIPDHPKALADESLARRNLTVSVKAFQVRKHLA
ncbi:hypothetical protein ACQZM9_08085 [Streptomyces sp. P11-1]|uniref:hypothetical protein n=1 Tax=Streptomyces sp. P11-1 TaxID=3423221 RepID=UPI003D2EA49D